MLGLGVFELLLIAVVVVVVIPPSSLPKFMRTAGQYYGQVRRMADEMRRALVLEADRQDADERYRAMMERRAKAEEDRRRAEAANPGVTPQVDPYESATPPVPPAEPPFGVSPVAVPPVADGDAEYQGLVDDPHGPYAAGRTLEDLHPMVGMDVPIPGFSAAEWAELPPKVRAALRRTPGGAA